MGLVFSGVQPTGNLHLGNYLGAIKNWVELQDKSKCLFSIVDLHAITVPQNPKELHQSILDTAATYIACGIDPSKSTIFQQSTVSGHAELSWLLACVTPLGWLNRMTQFKEKAGKHKENSCLGLYAYPVLMAADILLYKATHIPVGEDQKQHLELCRDIAGAFNRQYNIEYFKLPEPLIMGEAARVMSLRDGTQKMSKSDISEFSRINLTDDNDTIADKVKKAKSDAALGITYDPDNRPEASNLLTIYAALANISREIAEEKFRSTGFADFKKELAEVVIAALSPIRNEISKLKSDKAYLGSILKVGAENAAEIANKNLKEIKEIVGL